MDILFILVILVTAQLELCHADVIVGVTIQSYSNPNGTCYVESSSNRKCCDGPQRAFCNQGDTCDTYFKMCVGRMQDNWGCEGAFFQTKPVTDTNRLSNLTMMESRSDIWGPGMSIFVLVRDDDSHGSPIIEGHDHIDTLIDEIHFNPSPTKAGATYTHFEWQGKTRLSLSVAVWCDDGYYGQYCNTYCKAISPMSVCESDGHLTCQPSDALILEFKNQTSQQELPDLVFNTNRFLRQEVCHENTSGALYSTLDTNSNTLTFTADCSDRPVSPLVFESILKTEKQTTLDAYFTSGLITGAADISGGYGEHIIPNVHVGIELKKLSNPSGTSYNGEETSGQRRCCDLPKTYGCLATKDLCDLQASVCIGKFQNSVCIGAVTISPTYANTSSITTCGAIVLDQTNNIATVSHAMVGGFRLTQNSTTLSVIVKDIDTDGSSSDIIDVLSTNITVIPGQNATYANSIDVSINNTAAVSLRLIFWCAPGHSGPLCHADNGTDTCQPGWYGDDCEIQFNACSPNPCKHGGKCTLQQNNKFNCTCDPGYTGQSCEQDVDECKLHICQNNASCQNTDGGFICNCAPLWTGLICTEDKLPACDPSPCSNGKCVTDMTVKDNFRCICDEGWKGVYCNEHDLCRHGVARIMNGKETCSCDEGFKGVNCDADINECIGINPCQNGGTCVNGFGNFSCMCTQEYNGKNCETRAGSCRGVLCQHGGSCLDLDGGFLCMCTTDYTGNYCESKINICGNVTCDNNGTCYERFNDFMCNCSQYWSGKTCDADVNECSQSVCKHGGLCRNLVGSYNCDCPNGWTGQDCSADVDECKAPFKLCKYGTCINSAGSYKCVCTQGYSGPHCLMQSTSCVNVTCNGRGKCQEIVNGHICQCDAGYTGVDCESDVDECKLNICGSQGSSCTNTLGSYNCTCNPGWQGINCKNDVNECQSTTTVVCTGNGICTNTPGSYTCSCFPGFTGHDCSTFLDICVSLKCRHNGTCVLKNAEAKCACVTGWTGITCGDDVNECETEMPCQNSGICENIDGSYVCSCLSTWTGRNCETDVNECVSNPCKNGGRCTNTRGSFTCACQYGLIGMYCEIKNSISLTGNLINFMFERNFTKTEVAPLVTNTYKFLKDNLCNETISFYLKSARDNIMQIRAQCNNKTLQATQISEVVTKLPNDTLLHIFPFKLIGVRDSSMSSSVSIVTTRSSRTASSSNSPTRGSDSSPQSSTQKAWISTNWPVVAGSCGAFVIIVVAIALGIYTIRRLKKRREEEGSFANPSYTAEMKPYD